MMILRNLALGAAFFAGTGMAALRADVKTDYNHHVDFSQFHTYSWGKVQMANPLFDHRVRDEIDRDLQAKGWKEVPSGGEVVIFATGNVHNQHEMQTFYDGMGGGWGGGWGWGGWGWGGPGIGEADTTTVNQPVGNLVIDLFESPSKKLIWRGVSHENLSGKAVKNKKKMDKDIDKMLKDFPPKGR